MSDQQFYQKHVFFCVNCRDDGRQCCADANAGAMRDYAKKRIKSMDLSGPGAIRVNQAGCLDRCSEGPAVVIYPEGIWYTYVDEHDIDEIVDRHLVGGEIVTRLLI